MVLFVVVSEVCVVCFSSSIGMFEKIFCDGRSFSVCFVGFGGI